MARQKTSRQAGVGDGSATATGSPGRAARAPTWPRVSRTSTTDRPRPTHRIGKAQEERPGSQSRLGGEPARRERGQGHGAIAGRLVDAGRETPPHGSDEVDLHDHRRRPGQPLVEPEEHVRGDDPGPRRGDDEEQRDRQPDEPARDEDPLPPVSVGERAGHEVGEGLRHAERGHERERRRRPGQPERVAREQREDRPLLPIIPPTSALTATSSTNCRGWLAARARPAIGGGSSARCRRDSTARPRRARAAGTPASRPCP